MWFQKPPLGVGLDWSNPLNKGLMMHLAMNEGHGDVVRDLSLCGNHGKLHGMAFPSTPASGWNPGRKGIGLNFDGVDDSARILNNVAGGHSFTDLSDNITMTVRIKPSVVTGTPLYWFSANTIIEMRQSVNGSHAKVPFSFGVANSKLSLGVTDDGISSAEREYGSTVLDVDTRYFVAFTINGDDWEIFLNGVSDGSGTFTISTGDRSVGNIVSNLQVGARGTDAGTLAANFSGPIDEPRLHNRTLSAKEIMDYGINPFQVYLDE